MAVHLHIKSFAVVFYCLPTTGAARTLNPNSAHDVGRVIRPEVFCIFASVFSIRRNTRFVYFVMVCSRY